MALLDTLKAISESDETFPHLDDIYLDSSEHPLLQRAEGEAIAELITARGGCDWAAIDRVKAAGYSVYPGEQDSFGWLTGCIRTPKGVLMYG